MLEEPVAIYYEHPDWFEPLFAALERRHVPHVRLNVQDHFFDPAVRTSPYALVVNRVSAFPSGGSHPQIVLYVKQFLAHLDHIQAKVINGYQSYLVGTSKAMQLDIFEQLGLRYPRARVIHHPAQVVSAAADLTFPIVVKPNVGGSGTGILKFHSLSELQKAADEHFIDLGIDHTGLVQEYLEPEGQQIIRVEIMDGEFLYAICLATTERSFNYCPADGCNIGNPDLSVQDYAPPVDVIENVTRIIALSQADLGSVEYLINQADGQVYYYDINPLSNFVANAPRILGFDPTERLVDFILARAAG